MSNYVVSLEQIENAKDKTLQYHFSCKIKDINSDEPLEADLTLQSLGEFIEVRGNLKGILNLTCDVCLNEFKYNLNVKIDEMYAKKALAEDYAQETELKEGQFITDLNGAQEIDIYDLLYQSVILDLPNKKVCGINCNGKEFPKEEDLTDPRLEIFKNIRLEGQEGLEEKKQ